LLELPSTRSRQRVEPRGTPGFRFAPFGPEPPLRLQAVQRRVERPLLNQQHVVRDLLDPLGNRPTVFRLERHDFQNQEIEGALNEILRFAHRLDTLTVDNTSTYCR